MREGQLIRVLGPIDVLTADGAVSVGGTRVRALLGALVVGAGRAVPIDHLQEVLWGDAPPESADNTLQSYISHLRQVLGTDAVLLTDHSYELAVEPAHIDALLFETLLAQAIDSRSDPEECKRLSRDALHLWRGRPFGNLADDEPFVLEAYRLDELRLAAMELSLEADLALGHHDLIIGELEVAVEEHPYHERLWRLLIEALAAGGRRVEALRECTRMREVLADVGVEAGDELAALEAKILDGS
ncbi:MAG: winged helix-turn-helix domain-containing protein [Acidimicrobiia bacterium]|nr:winged helix-turn-helix domain-containing protein [Acidimicrobiia bacterium]